MDKKAFFRAGQPKNTYSFIVCILRSNNDGSCQKRSLSNGKRLKIPYFSGVSFLKLSSGYAIKGLFYSFAPIYSNRTCFPFSSKILSSFIFFNSRIIALRSTQRKFANAIKENGKKNTDVPDFLLCMRK